jgi:hypothetical protein
MCERERLSLIALRHGAARHWGAARGTGGTGERVGALAARERVGALAARERLGALAALASRPERPFVTDALQASVRHEDWASGRQNWPRQA